MPKHVFISYAHEDRQLAFRLREDLRQRGVVPWIDAFDLLPGQDWELAIKQALRDSSHVIVLISEHSVNKRGFVQKEVLEALSLLEQFPPGQIFVIPVRLDNSTPSHARLAQLQWADAGRDYGTALEQIIGSIAHPGRAVAPAIPMPDAAGALAIVERYLVSSDTESINAGEVKDAILRASSPVIVQIFFTAERIRRENWLANRTLMERTRSVFEALIETDNANRFHEYHAQLAFVLKDQRNPDYRRALVEITTAIDIRGEWTYASSVVYEGNRTQCRIRTDPNFLAGRPANDEVKAAIVADLRVALLDPRIASWFRQPPESDWLQLNGVLLSTLIQE